MCLSAAIDPEPLLQPLMHKAASPMSEGKIAGSEPGRVNRYRSHTCGALRAADVGNPVRVSIRAPSFAGLAWVTFTGSPGAVASRYASGTSRGGAVRSRRNTA